MSGLRIVHIESLDALLAAAEAWDELWRHSEATLPSLRAELLALWVMQFAGPDEFSAVAVESNGRLAAALPLIRRKVAAVLSAVSLPCNEWADSGDLLLDAEVEPDEVLKALAGGIREAGISLLWLDQAALDADRWKLFQQALCRDGMTVADRRSCQVGRVEIDHDWPAYKARWSRKHRQQMSRAARRMDNRGEVRLDVHSRLVPGDVEPAMRECFEVEDRGWKGKTGTSILRTPAMAEYYVRQAEQAARWTQLEIVVLRCGGRPAAFSYGLSAKGVFHSIKIGFDPEFAKYHPGQLLRYFQLEQYFADPERKALDFQGPMTEAHAAWRPERHTFGRVAVGHGLTGRATVWTYKHVWSRMRGGA